MTTYNVFKAEKYNCQNQKKTIKSACAFLSVFFYEWNDYRKQINEYTNNENTQRYYVRFEFCFLSFLNYLINNFIRIDR